MIDVAELVMTVFSGLSSLVIEDVEDAGDVIRVRARTRTGTVTCPGCGGETARVHSYRSTRGGWRARRLEESYAAPEARYEQREAVELAFIAALQHLTPRQRAALILRDVLGFSAREAAEALDTTVASVNGALQRARQATGKRFAGPSQQATLRSLGDARIRDLVARFTDAFESGDVDAILALLVEDATFAMPPHAALYRGRAAIAASWFMPSEHPPALRYVPARANGQLAFGAYHLDPDAGTYLPIALDVLTLRGARIAEITAVRTPGLFPRLGLPAELAPQPASFTPGGRRGP
jgi:RNA polymerase sigma-70 factor, ECF subfamily